MKSNFLVIYRDTHHWDIYIDGNRAFKIRGKPGRIELIDKDEKGFIYFKTVSLCMAYLCEELMFEN